MTASSRIVAATALLLPLLACASGGGGATGGGASAGWEGLAEARPAPLAGAAAVALGEFAFVPVAPFEVPTTLPAGAALMELTAADLLRRRDVRLVERRRFAAAAERERRGERATRGQPPLGVSRSADFIVMGTWARTPAGGALDLRLVEPASGRVAHAWRTETPAAPDAPALSRAAAEGILVALHQLGRLPGWDDALQRGLDPESGPRYRATGIPPAAVSAFFQGATAEDRFDWEAARAAYQRAAAAGGPGFHEPRTALARAARLRAGGTLAESE